jgi:DNA-binding NarL/FixJ family response regulator
MRSREVAKEHVTNNQNTRPSPPSATLPVMDGDAVFDELKAIDPNVRVVLSSGFAEQAKIGSMLARGLHGFIPKPYTREKLIEQIRSVLDA